MLISPSPSNLGFNSRHKVSLFVHELVPPRLASRFWPRRMHLLSAPASRSVDAVLQGTRTAYGVTAAPTMEEDSFMPELLLMREQVNVLLRVDELPVLFESSNGARRTPRGDRPALFVPSCLRVARPHHAPKLSLAAAPRQHYFRLPNHPQRSRNYGINHFTVPPNPCRQLFPLWKASSF